MANDYLDYSPWYLLRQGNYKQTTFTGVVGAGGGTTLLHKFGHGVIYGGIIKAEATSSLNLHEIKVIIDGIDDWYLTFGEMESFNLSSPHADLVYLLKYDDTNFMCCAALREGITFEKSYRVTYENKGVTDVILSCVIHYTLLE